MKKKKIEHPIGHPQKIIPGYPKTVTQEYQTSTVSSPAPLRVIKIPNQKFKNDRTQFYINRLETWSRTGPVLAAPRTKSFSPAEPFDYCIQSEMNTHYNYQRMAFPIGSLVISVFQRSHRQTFCIQKLFYIHFFSIINNHPLFQLLRPFL